MVTRWGYSDQLGAVAYGENQEEVFLGHSVSRTQNISEQTAQKIDEEVKRLVSDGLSEARRILTEKNHDLETLARGLLEYETLSGEEIKNLLNGTPPKRDDGDSGKKAARPSISVPNAGQTRPDGAGGMEPQPQA
jgi:cell division protease FtsH